MSKTMIRGVLLATLGGLAAPLANAAETGFYVGGFYGMADRDEVQASYDNTADDLYGLLGYAPVTFASTKFENEAKGYGFFGGYRLFQHLAVEAGYMLLGASEYRERSSGVTTLTTLSGPISSETDAALNLDSEIGGIAVSALGILPITYNAEIYGRAGAMFSTHKLRIFYGDVFGPLVDEFSESDVDFLAGIGASYTLAEVYALRAEFNRVFDAGDKEFGEADVDMITIGITVRF